jgi:hypothetical protein
MYPVAEMEGVCVLCDIAEVLDLRFKTPVPLVLHEERMLVEKAAGTLIIVKHDKSRDTHPE